jgi:hypothetical protein
MQIEVLPNDAYNFPRKFKPERTFLVRNNYHKAFAIAFSKNSFYVDLFDSSYEPIVKDLIKKLKESGLTYVRRI